MPGKSVKVGPHTWFFCLYIYIYIYIYIGRSEVRGRPTGKSFGFVSCVRTCSGREVGTHPKMYLSPFPFSLRTEGSRSTTDVSLFPLRNRNEIDAKSN